MPPRNHGHCLHKCMPRPPRLSVVRSIEFHFQASRPVKQRGLESVKHPTTRHFLKRMPTRSKSFPGTSAGVNNPESMLPPTDSPQNPRCSLHHARPARPPWHPCPSETWAAPGGPTHCAASRTHSACERASPRPQLPAPARSPTPTTPQPRSVQTSRNPPIPPAAAPRQHHPTMRTKLL